MFGPLVGKAVEPEPFENQNRHHGLGSGYGGRPPRTIEPSIIQAAILTLTMITTFVVSNNYRTFVTLTVSARLKL